MTDPNPADPKEVSRQAAVDRVPAQVRAVISIVRAILRDYAELNRLTDGQNHSDKDIAIAMARAVMTYNSMPPPLGNVSIEGFPDQALLIDGTIGYLLNSLAFHELANQATFSEGSTTLRLNGGASTWAQLGAQRAADFYGKARRQKISRNMSEALDAVSGMGLPSDYAILHMDWLTEL